MNSRRKFIKKSAALSALAITGVPGFGKNLEENFMDQNGKKPVVISTWNHGLAANAEAWKTLSAKGRALDAVENGVKLIEADPNEQSDQLQLILHHSPQHQVRGL